MRRSSLLVGLIGLFLITQMSCYFRATRQPKRWLTGTCSGACAYYASCKDVRGDRVSDAVYEACRIECDEVFSSSESLLAFESMVCDDVIAFVEGDSGRQPGEPPRVKRNARSGNGANGPAVAAPR